ncbi:MAG: trypsin-like peptidase domain-containing protein [Clostridiales bacterium]|nr:trypsin-like peptidase domain-containing protein [Clostridiales bacterium]
MDEEIRWGDTPQEGGGETSEEHRDSSDAVNFQLVSSPASDSGQKEGAWERNAGYGRAGSGYSSGSQNTDSGPGSFSQNTRGETGSEENPTQHKYGYYQTHSVVKPVSGEREDTDDSAHRLSKTVDFRQRAASTAVLAVIFGLVAGLAFQGVNYLWGEIFETGESTAASIGTTEKVSSVSDSSESMTLSDVMSASGSVAAVAEACMPSVVAITTVSEQEINSFFGTQQYLTEGSGSGIIVGENDDELLIATNNHVVEDATTVSVCFIGDDTSSGTGEDATTTSEETEETEGSGIETSGTSTDLNVEDAVSAQIKGTDSDNDLAVLAVQKSDISEEVMSQIKIAQLGSSDSLVVGEQVVAIGNALGYGQSVTSGWVSALNRTVTLEDGTSSSDLIQTDAAINPGNSGGALLNMQGEVIGINSAKYADSAVEGMGYAIPISKAQPILEELMSRETRDKVSDESKAAWLGIMAADLSSEAIQMYNMPSGAFVTEAVSGSPADQAGIQKGDIIVQFDGQSISGRDDLFSKLQYYEAGETVEIVVSRMLDGEYKEQTMEVTLGSKSDSE